MSARGDQTNGLPADGERFLPDVMQGIIELEHRHRYLFVANLVAGKTVLDIASGEGYGSATLARSASRVIGVDISPAAVEHARRRYRADNLEFLTGTCTAIPLKSGSVDVVVSFETIEHHAEHEGMLREIRRVLRPGGLLVISSPDKLEYSDKPSYRNPFHVRELYKDEFQTLVSAHFRHVRLFGQRVVCGSILLEEQGGQPIQFHRAAPGRSESGTASAQGMQALYWVALASDAELPGAGGSVYERRGPPLAADGPRPYITKLISAVATPNSSVLRSCLQSDWYLGRNPDLVAARVDPYQHWIAFGASEGRLPSDDPLALLEKLMEERTLAQSTQPRDA